MTVVLVVAALLVLGGKVLFDFSLALLIGVLIGTYSSIFIASPLIYLWRKKLR
jgi:preprotein translocase subunit SecF